LIESVPQVESRLRILTQHYDVSRETLLAETYVKASLHATLPDTQSHLIQNGLRLAERLLLSSETVRCQEVLEAMVPMVSESSMHSDSVTRYLNDYSDVLVLMQRHAEVIERVNGPSAEPAPEDVEILGRVYCLILRQWDRGLPWIQQTADPRISRAAQQELALGKSPNGQELQVVAAKWLDAASRATGRTADSMRLHAIDLLRRGRAVASGSTRSEIDRQLQQVLSSVPAHLMPLSADTVQGEGGSRPGRSRRSPQTPLF
jgi:hypothetical protein